ncbi:hypothetical protein M9Y10_000830 [Tritrichomonas musculus]|uniref:RasGEF domain containing protein n=1 Tax=Tritrichomonas musculus TaxID=1915356 RepID=A0ABR2L5A6_9EUKA
MSLPQAQSDQTPPKTSSTEEVSTQNQQKQTNEALNDQRYKWISQLFNENPQLLAFRERILPWTGGYSISNVVHTDSIASLYHANRHKILELIYQHLIAIGMYQTAQILQEECGHNFQQTDQDWDKTDLLILSSLGILPREDPWKITPDPHHKYIEEEFEEDFFSSHYVEDPKIINKELMDPNYDVVFKEEHDKDQGVSFHTIKLASLRRLILVAISTTLDDDLNRFFLSLHLVTSPNHFLEHLIFLFDFEPPADSNFEYNREITRRDIVNLIKKWVNYHGTFIGKNTLKSIARFQTRIIKDPSCSKFYVFANSILQAINKLHIPQSIPLEKAESPVIPNAQIIFKPNLKITDPSPIEAARQISIIFHMAFKSVYSREFIIAARDHCVSHQTPTLAEFSEFGKKFTLLILELIVNTSSSSMEKVITSLLEIGANLNSLKNFEALACIVRALRCREILSLPVMQVPANRDKLEKLYKECGEDPSSFQNYLNEVNSQFYSWGPSIPNIRAELKIDLLAYYSFSASATCLFTPYLKTLNESNSNLSGAKQSIYSNFDDNSNTNLALNDTLINNSYSQASFINGLINWEQIWTNSERTSIFYRFQYQRSYIFWPIPQIEKVIEKGPTMTEHQVIQKLENIRKKPQSK